MANLVTNRAPPRQAGWGRLARMPAPTLAAQRPRDARVVVAIVPHFLAAFVELDRSALRHAGDEGIAVGQAGRDDLLRHLDAPHFLAGAVVFHHLVLAVIRDQPIALRPALNPPAQ